MPLDVLQWLAYFVGDVLVDWSSNGALDPALNQLAVSNISFPPVTAPAQGKIFISHATAGQDSTDTITVVPGVPFGPFTLTPSRNTVPADDTSKVQIASSQIIDSDGNPVAANEPFNVLLSDTTLGDIITPDVDPSTPGHQLFTNSSWCADGECHGYAVAGFEHDHGSGSW